MDTLQKPIYAPVVIDFLTAVTEYCIFLEKSAPCAKKEFLERMTRLLPLIYVKASLLPIIEFEGDEDLAEHVTEDDYNSVRHYVWQILGGDDDYMEVFTPDMHFCEQPIVASISENLADIYQDLKNFAAAFADGNEINMNNAIVRVHENFTTYWGQKLVNVMRPLHNLLYDASES